MIGGGSSWGIRRTKNAWCPGSPGKKVFQEGKSRLLFHAAEKQHRVSTKNSLLDLATWMSVFTLT